MSGPTCLQNRQDVPEHSDSRRSEEQALFERLHAGDATARVALVNRFLPLARRLAWGMRGCEDLDDLEQVAAMGLVKAIDRFNLARGFAFSTFAVPTIQGELKRHYRDRVWSVGVPRTVRERCVRVERVSSALSGELGRPPTVAEIADRADCDRRPCSTFSHYLPPLLLSIPTTPRAAPRSGCGGPRVRGRR